MSEMENTERFMVQDDAAAEWCLRKIREAEKEREKWRAHYQEQLRKIDESTENTINYFTGLLAEYFDQVPHKVSKTQESYSLPSARLVRRQQQPQYELDDEKVIIWLSDAGRQDLLKAKVSVDWAKLKKLVTITPDGQNVMTADGEIIDGIAVTMRPDVFKVEMED